MNLETLRLFTRRFASACADGSANQAIVRHPAPVRGTGRCSFRMTRGGDHIAMLFSGTADSTFADGTNSRANDIADDWQIEQLRVALAPAPGETPCYQTVTFDGASSRTVQSGDFFATDPIPLRVKPGDDLLYEITLRGTCYPSHPEMQISASFESDAGTPADPHCFPVPLMIGTDRNADFCLGFLGDSITQGIGAGMDSRDHWVARIARGVPDSVSVWNLGIGYARAADAATDGAWLARAKCCDTVCVCLGVNDLIQRPGADVSADLARIVTCLKQNDRRVILFTVPPFNFEGEMLDAWRKTNRFIREELSQKVDACFDMAALLGNPSPNEHIARYGGHPDASGSEVVARAFLDSVLPQWIVKKENA